MEAQSGHKAVLLPDLTPAVRMLGMHVGDGSVIAVSVKRFRIMQLAEGVEAVVAVGFVGQREAPDTQRELSNLPSSAVVLRRETAMRLSYDVSSDMPNSFAISLLR